jgi:hypothetical protein
MKLLLITALTGLVCAPCLVPSHTQDPQPQDPQAKAMRDMMAKATQFTQPGKNHAQLERFLGKWSTELRFTMMGKQSPPERGTAEVSWVMPGRWLKLETSGSMMGIKAQTFQLLGYDNFKQSFVMTAINSVDTAMTHAEGDMDPGGKAMLLYGTLDEYLTGEHDKMVKYVWRFPSDDQMVLEIHDLPIGEQNTKVMEFHFTRAD